MKREKVDTLTRALKKSKVREELKVTTDILKHI